MHPLLSCMALFKQIQGAAVMSGLPIHRSGSNWVSPVCCNVRYMCSAAKKKKKKKNLKLRCDKCCNLYVNCNLLDRCGPVQVAFTVKAVLVLALASASIITSAVSPSRKTNLPSQCEIMSPTHCTVIGKPGMQPPQQPGSLLASVLVCSSMHGGHFQVEQRWVGTHMGNSSKVCFLYQNDYGPSPIT